MNLLPETERKNLKKGFKDRSIIIASILAILVFSTSCIMLLPSYFLAAGNYSKIILENNTSGISSEKMTDEILSLPEEIDSKLKFVQLSNTKIVFVDYISEVIKFLPKEIILKSISFSKEKTYESQKGDLIIISGVAANRDSLVDFSNSLKKSKMFSVIEVPISSLTKDKDLPFSMTIFIENSN